MKPIHFNLPRAARDPDEVLRLSQAASEVGQSQELLRVLCHSGAIRHHQRQPGSVILIVRRDLAAAYPSLYHGSNQ